MSMDIDFATFAAIVLLIGAIYLWGVIRKPIKPPDMTPITFMEGENVHDLTAWDAAVLIAAERAEQRKSGRLLGKPIHVVLRKGADYNVWIHAKWLYYYGEPSGVTIDFEDQFDTPTGESNGRPRDILDRADLAPADTTERFDATSMVERWYRQR